MRLILATAAALALTATALPGAATAQDRPPAYTNAEACLRDRVADAVSVSSGAADAADFLLNYLCAETVSYASAYERNSLLLEAFSSLADMDDYDAEGDADRAAALAAEAAGEAIEASADSDAPPVPELLASDDSFSADPFEGMYVDPVTGELKSSDPDVAMSALMPMLSQMMGLQMGGPNGTAPLFLRTLAGELVLQHRR